ncbi:MAG: hypothetical protein WBB85_17780, partial [Albidovulum sp.]|uniref:hypothetical protein n=1 Tax=Albidovulum sp. TaxID=1872424 RepID=UPI003C9D4516
MALKMLAIAAASGRIAYVYFIGDHLMDWRISHKASKTPDNAIAAAKTWIADLTPDVVVFEQAETAAKKGLHAKALIAAMAEVAAAAPLLDVRIEREQHYPNKYFEAAALAE